LVDLAVVNLTLIDLPGLTKVAVGMTTNFFVSFYLLYLKASLNRSLISIYMFSAEGQPDSIVEDIDNMVRSYVEKVLLCLQEDFHNDICNDGFAVLYIS